MVCPCCSKFYAEWDTRCPVCEIDLVLESALERPKKMTIAEQLEDIIKKCLPTQQRYTEEISHFLCCGSVRDGAMRKYVFADHSAMLFDGASWGAGCSECMRFALDHTEYGKGCP